MRRQMLWCVLIPVLFTVACGAEGSNLTGPSSTIPDVAGNYSGMSTISDYGQTMDECPTTTSVTQTSDGAISMAPLQVGGTCGFSVPMGSMTIDATGSLGQASGVIDSSCGRYEYAMSGGFFGRTFKGSITYTSKTCAPFNVTINLSR